MRWVALCFLVACGRIAFDPTGDGGMGADMGVLPEGNVAFVTSSVHVPGMLGTLAAADAICMARAGEAGLAGNFMAWLSTSAINARDRFPGARGWYRVDGQPLVDTVTDLVGPGLLHPIRLDEHGRDFREDYTYYVATGSYAGVVGQNCVDFTDTNDVLQAGYPQYTGDGWNNTNAPSCMDQMHLYCFQIDHAQPLTFARASGRQAFLSSAAFDPGAGLLAADMICEADATTAGLAGTFKALLPGALPAASRFDTFGPPWVRVDGISLAPTADALLRGESVAPLHTTADGTIVEALPMTGTHMLTAYEQPDPIRTCDGWTNPNGTSTKGYSSATGGHTFTQTTSDCVGPVSVYCLEE